MSKISKRPAVLMPTKEEDKVITAAAKSDPDAPPLTPTQLKAMAAAFLTWSAEIQEQKIARFGALQP